VLDQLAFKQDQHTYQKLAKKTNLQFGKHFARLQHLMQGASWKHLHYNAAVRFRLKSVHQLADEGSLGELPLNLYLLGKCVLLLLLLQHEFVHGFDRRPCFGVLIRALVDKGLGARSEQAIDPPSHFVVLVDRLNDFSADWHRYGVFAE
jgi:hypothetical protein